EDAAGRIYAATGELSVSEWIDSAFHTVHPKIDPTSLPVWTSPFGLLDREGDWWLATNRGLNRFSKVSSLSALDGKAPDAVYNKASGLHSDEAFHLFEDRNGDIWFSQFPARPAERRMVRISRATGEAHLFTPDEGLPDGKSATSFAEDKFGNLWM